MTLEMKKAIVRMLTNTYSIQTSNLLDIQLNDILEVTEIYHILAACKLVAQKNGVEFKLPKEIIDIKDLIEQLSDYYTPKPSIYFAGSFGDKFQYWTYRKLCEDLRKVIGYVIINEDINKAINYLWQNDIRLPYYLSQRTENDGVIVNYVREPIYWAPGNSDESIVDFPVADQWDILVKIVRKLTSKG